MIAKTILQPVSYTHLFQVSFQIRGRSDENQRIRFFHNIVDVGTESDTLGIEFHSCQISRIVPQSLEISDAVIASHIPIDRVLSLIHI